MNALHSAKPRKAELIRVRCTPNWKTRVETIAALVESDVSDFLRDSVNARVEKLMLENPVIRLHVTR